MSRHDREITDSREILSIVNECKVIRLAMLDEQGLPYIIPLNFGYRFADGVFTFYCHSAREGRKLELLRRDPRDQPLVLRAEARVSFEMDCRGELQSADHACGYGYYYASVIGSGTAELIEGAEKLDALSALMRHMSGREDTFTEEQARGVAVLAIRARSLSAKAKKH